MNLQPHIKHTLLQAILFFGGIILSLGMHAQVHLAFNGRVSLPAEAVAPITLTIEQNGDLNEMRIPQSGRFSSLTAITDSLVITVSSPGHISKRIVVSVVDNKDLAYLEQVRFNVALERQPEDQALEYAGPVGRVELGRRGNDGVARFIPIQQRKVSNMDPSLASR